MSKLRVTELDFFEIKENLKDYLRGRPEFQDYDFEGSGLTVLIDMLAYNTFYNSFYLNQVANEMFLDSAVLRESAVSRAKHLGYTPRSSTAAIAKVSVEFFPGTPYPASIDIPKDTAFTSEVNGRRYTFITNESVIVERNLYNEYQVDEVELIEGTRLTQTFIVDRSEDQRFVLENDNIDTTSLLVNVKPSETSSNQLAYILNEDINVLDGDSRVYFLQEVEFGKFEIYFGDGIAGRELEDGEVVIVEYIVTNGADANLCNTFSPVRKIAGLNGTVIETVQEALGGNSGESIPSIKHLAPLSYEAQNRAVNKNDFETLIKMDFPNIDSVRVWGGEDNDPPEFGRTFISLKPTEGFVLSVRQKQDIINRIIRDRMIVALEPVLIDPDFTTIVLNSAVTYKSFDTTKSEAELRSEIIQGILEFGDDNLDRFDTHFRYSNLCNMIDELDFSIQNNLTEVQMKKSFTPTIGAPAQFILQFNNQVHKGDYLNELPTLTSSSFGIRGFDEAYFSDDGKGSVFIYRFVGTERRTLIENVGTIDYDTGKVIINKFSPESLPDGVTTVEIFVCPEENDIFPLRNQIIVFEEENITVNMTDESLPSLE